MGSFFSEDNPVFRFLGLVTDLILLNLFTLICCIPVVTGGAALSAMHYSLLHLLRGEESYISRMFFTQFKKNLKSATPLWLLMLVFAGLSWMDIQILRSTDAAVPQPVRYAFFMLVLLLFMVIQYMMPLVSRYECSLKEYVVQSAVLAVGFLPRTVLMVLLEAAWALLFVTYWQYLLPLYLLLGFTGPGMLRALLYNGIFKKLEAGLKKPEEEKEEETKEETEEK
ncbi:MAG: YesL family protein [Lachnospiraceae bacterium]|nr:YesL family protein [Lachnospiraceae bacterium]